MGEVAMLTGGCSCGAVRYVVRGEPLGATICHCRDCQRASGSGHVPVLIVAKADFSVEGDYLSYASPGGSGKKAVRNFCPNCGSLLFGTPELVPDMVALYVGSLDDGSAFKPTRSIFTDHRPAWDRTGEGLEQFPTVPSHAG